MLHMTLEKIPRGFNPDLMSREELVAVMQRRNLSKGEWFPIVSYILGTLRMRRYMKQGLMNKATMEANWLQDLHDNAVHPTLQWRNR